VAQLLNPRHARHPAGQALRSNKNIWRIPLRRGQSQSVAEKFLFSSRKTDSAEYAPNGGAIAFVSDRLGTRQIWVAKASGSDPVPLSSVGPEVPIGTPHRSPDGRQIVFDTVWNGHSAIAIMSADGSNPRVFAGDPWDDMMPSWSHDGRWIYFTCRINGAVRSRRSDRAHVDNTKYLLSAIRNQPGRFFT
jgi:Tol biopolymer transport system component